MSTITSDDAMNGPEAKRARLAQIREKFGKATIGSITITWDEIRQTLEGSYSNVKTLIIKQAVLRNAVSIKPEVIAPHSLVLTELEQEVGNVVKSSLTRKRWGDLCHTGQWIRLAVVRPSAEYRSNIPPGDPLVLPEPHLIPPMIYLVGQWLPGLQAFFLFPGDVDELEFMESLGVSCPSMPCIAFATTFGIDSLVLVDSTFTRDNYLASIHGSASASALGTGAVYSSAPTSSSGLSDEERTFLFGSSTGVPSLLPHLGASSLDSSMATQLIATQSASTTTLAPTDSSSPGDRPPTKERSPSRHSSSSDDVNDGTLIKYFYDNDGNPYQQLGGDGKLVRANLGKWMPYRRMALPHRRTLLFKSDQSLDAGWVKTVLERTSRSGQRSGEWEGMDEYMFLPNPTRSINRLYLFDDKDMVKLTAFLNAEYAGYDYGSDRYVSLMDFLPTRVRDDLVSGWTTLAAQYSTPLALPDRWLTEPLLMDMLSNFCQVYHLLYGIDMKSFKSAVQERFVTDPRPSYYPEVWRLAIETGLCHFGAYVNNTELSSCSSAHTGKGKRLTGSLPAQHFATKLQELVLSALDLVSTLALRDTLTASIHLAQIVWFKNGVTNAGVGLTIFGASVPSAPKIDPPNPAKKDAKRKPKKVSGAPGTTDPKKSVKRSCLYNVCYVLGVTKETGEAFNECTPEQHCRTRLRHYTTPAEILASTVKSTIVKELETTRQMSTTLSKPNSPVKAALLAALAGSGGEA